MLQVPKVRVCLHWKNGRGSVLALDTVGNTDSLHMRAEKVR